ncbi:MAG TPA: hypothetical protein PKZ84_10490 [Anaerolineae bacterium]|nr:hypothetical protein [Anaerolineae bacterium]HQI85064.1 hypothetical protein [Anaerolineae bacterium]
MDEEKVVDVEVVETPAAPAAATVTLPSFNKVVDETAKVMESLGKALIKAAQDVSNLMVVPVDKVTRAQLDLLVEAGVAPTRTKAAASLLKESVENRKEIFDKIEKTRSQIETLKQQLHSLVGSAS